MAVDYTKLAATAACLIQENGRTVVFNQIDQVAADTNQPWKGPTDPESGPTSTTTVSAVFVPPSSASSLGMNTVSEDMLSKVREIAIVEPGSFDLATADVVIDNGQRKVIEFVETLRPAGVTLLHYVGVRR